jgi:hypothetical protein
LTRPLFIALILGSYDAQTKACMETAKEGIVKSFSGESVYILILDQVEMYEAGTVQVLAEVFVAEDKISLFVFQNAQLIDIEDIKLENTDLDSTVYTFLKEKYDVTELNKTPIIEKLNALMLIARAIFFLRQKEETRGGEYLELMHALYKGYSEKIYLFKKDGIELSAMLMEYLDKHKVIMRTYQRELDLIDSMVRMIKYRLQETANIS